MWSWVSRAAVCLAGAIVACDHPAPFKPGDYTPNGPLGSGPAVRLTYNPGTDLAPLWLPGDSGILYSAQRIDRVDQDRCFAVLPSSGGTISRYACRTSAGDDSVDVFEGGSPIPVTTVRQRNFFQIASDQPERGAVHLEHTWALVPRRP